jgi:hypothetical protein
MRSNKLALLVITVSLAACASSSQAGTASAPEAASGQSPTRITSSEIAKADVATAYDAVYQLHRTWFRDMSAGASGSVLLYVDNRAVDDGAAGLRTIPAKEVAEINYLKSADAVLRFGARATGGAIIVTRK